MDAIYALSQLSVLNVNNFGSLHFYTSLLWLRLLCSCIVKYISLLCYVTVPGAHYDIICTNAAIRKMLTQKYLFIQKMHNSYWNSKPILEKSVTKERNGNIRQDSFLFQCFRVYIHACLKSLTLKFVKFTWIYNAIHSNGYTQQWL